jgi:hypothetical protein
MSAFRGAPVELGAVERALEALREAERLLVVAASSLIAERGDSGGDRHHPRLVPLLEFVMNPGFSVPVRAEREVGMALASLRVAADTLESDDPLVPVLRHTTRLRRPDRSTMVPGDDHQRELVVDELIELVREAFERLRHRDVRLLSRVPPLVDWSTLDPQDEVVLNDAGLGWWGFARRAGVVAAGLTGLSGVSWWWLLLAAG